MQNFKKEENVISTRGNGGRSVLLGLIQAERTVALPVATVSKHIVRAGVRISAAWNGWNIIEASSCAPVRFKFKCNLFREIVQGALLSKRTPFAEKNSAFSMSEGEATLCCESNERGESEMVPVAWDLCMVSQSGCSQMYLDTVPGTASMWSKPLKLSGCQSHLENETSCTRWKCH